MVSHPIRMMLLAAVLVAVAGLGGGCKKKTASGGHAPGATEPASNLSPGPSALLPARPAVPAGWIEFRHPDGAYSIYTPTRLVPQASATHAVMTQPVPPGRALMSKFATSKYEGPSSLFCEMEVDAFSPELVEGTRTAMERRKAYGKRSSVTWAGHPAFEEIEELDGAGGVSSLHVHRWMFVGNRLYGASIWGMKGHPTAQERAAFFDSLTVGK